MREAMDRFLEEKFTQSDQSGGSERTGDERTGAPGSRGGEQPDTSRSNGGALGFSADIVERDDQFVIRAALPGVDPADLDVTLDGQSLVIRGERSAFEQKSGERWLLREHSSGWFERSFQLPSAVDAEQAEAQFAQGVLTLTVPKASVSSGRPIRVNTSADRPKASSPAMVNPTVADPTKPEKSARRGRGTDASTVDATDTPNDDVVSAESESSFPASDPPSWTPERA